jgi:hypothetical protein
MTSLEKLIRYQNFLIDQVKNKLLTIERDIQNADDMCTSLKHSLDQEIRQSLRFIEIPQTFENYYEYLQKKIKIFQKKKEDLLKEKITFSDYLKQHIFTHKRYEKIIDIQDQKILEELQQKERRMS